MHHRAVHHRYRNSQKRIHLEDVVYFLASATQNRERYFEEQIFCEVFLENLRICQKLKVFELYGYFLGYDHFHLMVKPNNEWNYSEVMQSLKRNTSRDINKLIHFSAGGITKSSRYREVSHQTIGENMDSRLQEWAKFLKGDHHRFQWQSSFHDHITRNERDFLNHLNYIRGNPFKHDMPENWPYVWINEEMEPP